MGDRAQGEAGRWWQMLHSPIAHLVAVNVESVELHRVMAHPDIEVLFLVPRSYASYVIAREVAARCHPIRCHLGAHLFSGADAFDPLLLLRLAARLGGAALGLLRRLLLRLLARELLLPDPLLLATQPVRLQLFTHLGIYY